MQQLTVRLKLSPDPETRERLLSLIRAVNDCCNWIALEAQIADVTRRFDLHHLTYRRGRECFGLGADMMCAAYNRVAAILRRRHAPTFQITGAVDLHKRDFRISDGSVSIAAGGRVTVPFSVRPGVDLLNHHGQAKLGVTRSGGLFLAVAIQRTTPCATGGDGLGVDLGIANIATDSNGKRYSGAALRGVRYRRRQLRVKLQSKGTRSAKRRLKRMRRREALHARDVNHCISKHLVAEAERTKSAIVLEDLSGIHRRVRATRRKQRAELSSWAFYQLRQFVVYKANLAGVPVIFVDPRNTSRECSSCGHTDKRNRTNQSTFSCRACGFRAHADINAALVIRDRGRAHLNAPYATGSHLVASPFGVS